MTTEATAPTVIDNYVAAVASNAPGIDPSLIAAIIAFIMQMISTCTQPKPSDITSASNTRRITLYRAMLANGVRPLSAKGRELTDAMELAASGVQQADAEKFITMCG